MCYCVSGLVFRNCEYNFDIPTETGVNIILTFRQRLVYSLNYKVCCFVLAAL